MNDIAFCSIALSHKDWGDVYLEQQDRLKESILKIYPDAKLFFHRNTYAPGSKKFFDSLYGFKPHIVNEALTAGYKQILWLDPAMILLDKVDDLFRYSVAAVKDESSFHNMISDRCRDYYGLTNEGIKKDDWRLVGGSLYWFDFNKPITKYIFNMWIEAERMGLFGSQTEQASEQLQGHRSDETCMAIAMYLHGIEPQTNQELRYCCTDTPMTQKKHFK